MKLPKFSLYGENDPKIEEDIQSSLSLRQWSDLSDSEKKTAFRQLKNNGWLSPHSKEILQLIE